MDENANDKKLPIGLAGLVLLAGAGMWLMKKQKPKHLEQPETMFDERPYLERYPDAKNLTPDELAIAIEEERLRRQEMSCEMLTKTLKTHHDMQMSILRNMGGA